MILSIENSFKLYRTYRARIKANTHIKNRAFQRRHFASINNFEFQESTTVESTIGLSDNDNIVLNYIYGTINDIQFWTADSRFDYTVIDGQAKFIKRTVTALFVDNTLPNYKIVRRDSIIDRDVMNLGEYTKNSFKITQHFDKKYIFKSPPGLERDALYIFTPELLELIIKFKPWLLETNDNRVLIHYDWAVESEAEYRDLAEMIQILGSEFIDNTKKYNRN
jgi:hypothetical protein